MSNYSFIIGLLLERTNINIQISAIPVYNYQTQINFSAFEWNKKNKNYNLKPNTIAIAVKESVKIKSIVLSLPENINYEMGRSL